MSCFIDGCGGGDWCWHGRGWGSFNGSSGSKGSCGNDRRSFCRGKIGVVGVVVGPLPWVVLSRASSPSLESSNMLVIVCVLWVLTGTLVLRFFEIHFTSRMITLI